MDEKKVIRSRQQGSTRWKSFLDYLIAFITSWIDEVRAVDTVYLEFSKAFGAVSDNIMVMNLSKCGIKKWTVSWIESCLTGRA